MKRKIILVFIVACALAIIGTFLSTLQKPLTQKEINSNFHEYAKTANASILYHKVGEVFKPVGRIEAETLVHLQGIDTSYFQLMNTKYYVYYEDIVEVEPFVLEDSYKNEVTIKEQAILKSLDNQAAVTINESITLPVERIQNDYYVIFNQQKYRLLIQDNVFNTYENPAKEIPVIMYHFFYAGSVKRERDSMFVEVNNFKEQMDYLKNNNYYTPTVKELEMFLDGKITLPEKSVVLTIDDGAASVYEYAYPILKENHIRAIFYIITSKIFAWDPAVAKEWHFNQKMYDELKADPLIELNSHSHNMHDASPSKTVNSIDKVSLEQGIEDIKASSDYLGNKDSFSYPFGTYNESVKDMVRQAGYTMAFTINPGKVKPGDDKLELKRIWIYRETSLSAFIKIVTP